MMFDIVVTDFLIILLIISLFTIIQSLFGIGILVFGTPTLLLLGYEFTEVLSFLLPSSIIVSFCQIYQNPDLIKLYRLNVIFYLLPMVLVGLLTVIYIANLNLMFFVGVILFITFITRQLPKLSIYLNKFFSNNFKFGLMLTGFIHGSTNLGGAPLLAITNGLYDNKREIQINIAYAYFSMAIIQMIVLYVTNELIFKLYLLIFPLVSVVIFWLFGNKFFNLTSELLYQNMLNSLIFIYALLLVYNSF